MKVHCALIIRTFIGMAAASRRNLALRYSLYSKQPISVHSTSALANPQNSRFYSEWRLATEDVKRKFKRSSEYNGDKSFRKNALSITDNEYNNNDAGKNFTSVTADCVVKDRREHNNNEDGSLKASAKIRRPRPQEVPWQKELDSSVHLIGRIYKPVQIKPVQSGEAFALTELRVGHYKQTICFTLAFWSALAEIAVRHLKENDKVYVSGFLVLPSTAGEDKLQVTATTINFIENRTVINKDPPLQYKKSESSNSGKNAQDAAIIESVWQAFFNSPHEWWDNRTNKRDARIPDFRHKDTGEALWIEGGLNPVWVKDELAALDSRMKESEECGRGGSSPRFWG